MCCTIASPKPVPPISRVRCSPPRKNLLNSRGNYQSGVYDTVLENDDLDRNPSPKTVPYFVYYVNNSRFSNDLNLFTLACAYDFTEAVKELLDLPVDSEPELAPVSM